MRSNRLMRTIQSGVLLAAASLVALGLGEWLVRHLVPQPRPLTIALRGLHVPDLELGYVMVANFARHVHTPAFTCDVRTNRLGLREREITPHVAGRLRVVGIGDSFMLGIHAGPPDSCFIERLGHTLDATLRAHPVTTADGRTWSSAEAINAGVDGYGTEQEVGLLERLGPALEPDAILLAFYLGNDFTDNAGRTRMTVADGYQMLAASEPGYREHFRPLQRRARLWLHAHSELYAFMKERLWNPLRRRTAPAPQQAPGGGPPTPKALEEFIYDAGFADALRAMPSAQMDASLAATRRAFDVLHRWCELHHVPVLVVALPAEQQVSPAARQRWLQRFGLQEAALDFTLPNQRLLAITSATALPCFDLTPGMAAAVARGADVHVHGDAHWNAAGHAVAARLLAEPVLEDLVQLPVPLLGTR